MNRDIFSMIASLSVIPLQPGERDPFAPRRAAPRTRLPDMVGLEGHLVTGESLKGMIR